MRGRTISAARELEVRGQTHTLFGTDRPEPIADHTIGVDRPIPAEKSQEGTGAVSQLRAGVVAGWAQRAETRRIKQQASGTHTERSGNRREVDYLCCHSKPRPVTLLRQPELQVNGHPLPQTKSVILDVLALALGFGRHGGTLRAQTSLWLDIVHANERSPYRRFRPPCRNYPTCAHCTNQPRSTETCKSARIWLQWARPVRLGQSDFGS